MADVYKAVKEYGQFKVDSERLFKQDVKDILDSIKIERLISQPTTTLKRAMQDILYIYIQDYLPDILKEKAKERTAITKAYKRKSNK